MSMPIRAPLWKSVGRNHLLSEQIDQQQGCVAFGAVAAQADGATEEIALWAATLADEAFTTTRALVHRLRRHCPATLELLAEALQVGRAGAVTEAEGMLLMGRASNSVREMRRVPRRIPDSQGHHHHANRHAWTC